MSVSTFGYDEVPSVLKNGYKVQRSGWNGKNMFIFFIPGGSWDFEVDVYGTDGLETLPFICMKTADNKLVPWLASQTDMLATDWQIVD